MMRGESRTFVLPGWSDGKEGKRVQQTGERQEAMPPVPPFTEETARQKVQTAEDAWNT